MSHGHDFWGGYYGQGGLFPDGDDKDDTEGETPDEGDAVKTKHKKKGNKTKGSNQGNYVTYKKCYEDHPAVKIGGGTFYGGSCGYPHWTGCDIYIGFQHGSMHVEPFDPSTELIVHVMHEVPDMGIPPNHDKYKALVEWTAAQLKEGKIVHAGCIGGHGRTGMFLACLRMYIDGDKEAITWVRKNYCTKAVESSSQMSYLKDKWGITPVEPAKAVATSPTKPSGSWPPGYSGGNGNGHWPTYGSSELKRSTQGSFADALSSFRPIKSNRRLFGSGAI